jgi:nucleotide-binding universal stress UspA family protein
MKILMAMDLMARSDRALARSFLLSRKFDASLGIVHVVDENQPGI